MRAAGVVWIPEPSCHRQAAQGCSSRRSRRRLRRASHDADAHNQSDARSEQVQARRIQRQLRWWPHHEPGARALARQLGRHRRHVPDRRSGRHGIHPAGGEVARLSGQGQHLRQVVRDHDAQRSHRSPDQTDLRILDHPRPVGHAGVRGQGDCDHRSHHTWAGWAQHRLRLEPGGIRPARRARSSRTPATITDWSGTRCGRVCWRAARSSTGTAASSSCAGSRPIQYPFNVHAHSSCRPASHPRVAISRRKPQTHCSRR